MRHPHHIRARGGDAFSNLGIPIKGMPYLLYKKSWVSQDQILISILAVFHSTAPFQP